MTVRVIPNPIIIKMMSSSRSPIQIKNMLNAGTRLENGIGRGSDKNAADNTIANPQSMWDALDAVIGCLKVEIFEVKLLKRTAAL